MTRLLFNFFFLTLYLWIKYIVLYISTAYGLILPTPESSCGTSMNHGTNHGTRVNPSREKFPNPQRQYSQIGGFRLGGGVWIGFEILDLVGLRVDCMSMVASHGQCHASSSILRAGPSSGRKKKILFNSVVCVCHFLTSVSSSFN